MTSVDNFPADALDDSLRRPAILGLSVIALFVFGLGGWAALAPLNSAIVAEGVVIVSDLRKPVQHPVGGRVVMLVAREGMRVQAGDVLLRLDDTQIRAERDSLAVRLTELEAMRARWLAERDTVPMVIPPDQIDEQRWRTQQRLLEERRRQHLSELAALSEQKNQLGQTIRGQEAQVAGLQEQLRLIWDEHKGLKQLYDKGLTPRSRILALERGAADLEGRRGDLASQIASRRAGLAETEFRLEKMRGDRRTEIAEGLRVSEAELATLRPRATGLNSLLDQSTVLAPATGMIVNQTLTAQGAVLAPGAVAMEIVPDEEPLVIDTQLPPDKIDNVSPGQPARLRLLALKKEGMPVVMGTVSQISADRLIDNRTGMPYFRARVTVDRGELAHIPGARLYPGMPVEIMIQTGARSALRYLAEPALRRFERSMTEE